jgi:hypothetical protein
MSYVTHLTVIGSGMQSLLRQVDGDNQQLDERHLSQAKQVREEQAASAVAARDDLSGDAGSLNSLRYEQGHVVSGDDW